MANENKESEFTTNPVLAVLDLAAKKGLKFDFDGDGTYESLDDLVSGKDGDALASWAINEKLPNLSSSTLCFKLKVITLQTGLIYCFFIIQIGL